MKTNTKATQAKFAVPAALTSGLLAYPEDLQHKTHYVPQQALLALVDIMHSHDLHTLQSRRAGGASDVYMTVRPGQFAYLLSCIAESMDVDFSTVQRTLQMRASQPEFSGEKP